ncbi:hypothetical protein C6P40_003807 [Pichia californica]|uniref:L-type lectin-like domain-containing protein n=1 Tax=Pichia californica TaxID=460514 RepID=A0A9P7BGI8_9ASCO|nr:hypothetical protein C6P42_003699 [[Candida] californica]KAG0690106.1 hypothetical protein C6P40_003807 [[Candida] californica]
MDISIGGSGPSFAQKARRVYGRLTPKGRLVFGIIAVIFIWFLLPSWSSKKNNDDGDYYNVKDDSKDKYSTSVSRDQFHTLSDLLHKSPKVRPVSLSYLSLPPYLNSANQFQHYINGGNMLLSKLAEEVKLVKDSPKNSGYLFSKNLISQDDISAFEVELSFQITGEQEKISLIGDGMAIWLTTEQLKQGDVFGMQSNFNGLGIFIDTYKNYNGKKNRHAFPYLSIQRNRGIEGYYDKSTDGVDTEIGGCSLHRIYNNEDPTKLRITYVRQANIFEIDVDVAGTGDWRTCFRKENAELDDFIPIARPLYLGVSAETGELHHNVDLYSINAYSFRGEDGLPLQNIDSLGEGIQVYDLRDDPKVQEENQKLKDRKDNRRQKRRTLNRLKRQEKKLKALDREKYGGDHGFVGWVFRGVLYFIKMIFILFLVLVSLYACVVGYRVYKDKQRKKHTGGLL